MDLAEWIIMHKRYPLSRTSTPKEETAIMGKWKRVRKAYKIALEYAINDDESDDDETESNNECIKGCYAVMEYIERQTGKTMLELEEEDDNSTSTWWKG